MYRMMYRTTVHDQGQGHSLIFMLNFYSVSFCKAFDGFDSCLA